MSALAIIVDNTDKARVTYLGTWIPATTGNKNVYNGTTSYTKAPGRARITFVGSQVEVAGVVPNNDSGSVVSPIVSTYFIDNEVAGNHSALPLQTEQDNILFFRSANLGPGAHTLEIDVTNATDDFPFILDYIRFVPPAPTRTLSPLPSTTSSSSSSTPPLSHSTVEVSSSDTKTTTRPVSSTFKMGITTVITPPTFEPTSTNVLSASETTVFTSDAAGGSTSTHTGAVVGPVVGGIIAFFVALSALLWWKRKRRSLGGENKTVEKGDRHARPVPKSGITPFLLPRDYGSSSANVIRPETAAPLAPHSVLGMPGVTSSSRSSGKAAVMNNNKGRGSMSVHRSEGHGTHNRLGSVTGSRNVREESEQSARRSVSRHQQRSHQDQSDLCSPRSSVELQPPRHGDIVEDTASQASTELLPAYTL